MLGTKILPAVLVAAPAALWLAAQPSFGETAGDTCRASPGAAAPQGLHWYYRVDRATKRHCWYLTTGGIHVHSFANVAAPAPSQHENSGEPAGAATNTAVQTATPQTPASQTASAEAPLPEPSVRQHRAIDFSARWQEMPKSLDLDAHDVTPPSNDYAGEGGATIAVAQMPSSPFVIADQDGTREQSNGLRQRSKPGTGFGSILLACGLGILFLFLCREALKLAGMLRLEAKRRQARAAFPESFPMAAPTADVDEITPDNAFGPALVPDILDSDAEISLSDFVSILRRADAAPYSPRSFAPPGQQAPSHQLAKIPAVRRILRRKSLRRSHLALKASSRSYAAV
ncbi:MAG: hypothetical protein WAK55_13555 [Xanthobacteraceae bacterium]|jgi:hypothetical protein